MWHPYYPVYIGLACDTFSSQLSCSYQRLPTYSRKISANWQLKTGINGEVQRAMESVSRRIHLSSGAKPEITSGLFSLMSGTKRPESCAFRSAKCTVNYLAKPRLGPRARYSMELFWFRFPQVVDPHHDFDSQTIPQRVERVHLGAP